MSNTRKIQVSFNGGEITEELFGRIDDGKMQMGLAICRNFQVLPHGPVTNRAGTKFVREVKDSSKATRVINFVYSTTQTFCVEEGAGYFRFHTQGATLLAGSPAAYNGATTYAVGDLVSSAGTSYYCIAATTGNAPPNVTYWYAMPSSGVYEIPNPYAEADLFDLHYIQSEDVLTIVHPTYAPRELRRMGATKWVLSTISFVSDLAAPTGVSATNTGAGAISYSYKVSAVGSNGIEEGLASSAATCTNNLATAGNYNTVSWSSVSGASRYNVYKQSNGLYGYIGQTDSTSFKDDNITADVGTTPPIQNNPFGSSGNYPSAVSYFEQRRWFGGTTNSPQSLWFTRSGTESNLSYSIPYKDDDGGNIRVRAREANTIRHLVPLTSLVALTSAGEWRVTSVNSDVITPTSISVRPQSYIGASNVQPVIVNSNIVYASARGGHMRELAYSWQSNGFITGDLCLRAPHLFDEYTIKDMTYVKSPYPTVWAVSSNGQLLGLTYVPEQQIGAWHRHDTEDGDGYFESVTSVSEGDDDVVYVVVRRTINGSTKRYIERFEPRKFTALEDAFFVDCGATYDGSPITTINTGLSHLEGKTVNILADGAVHPQRVVTGGAITLDQAASKIHIGLPITADIKTPPFSQMSKNDGAAGQGRQKNVNKSWLRVFRSSGVFAGPSFDKLIEDKQRTTEPYGSPPSLKSEEIPIMLTPTWGDSGAVCVRQSDPLPLTITALTMEVSLGS